MKNLKKKVVNVKTGKALELSDVAISNLKKMGKFSEYDILPEIPTSFTINYSPSESSEVIEEIKSEEPEVLIEEPKKKKKKSTEENS